MPECSFHASSHWSNNLLFLFVASFLLLLLLLFAAVVVDVVDFAIVLPVFDGLDEDEKLLLHRRLLPEVIHLILPSLIKRR